jgi:hypothetical protein
MRGAQLCNQCASPRFPGSCCNGRANSRRTSGMLLKPAICSRSAGVRAVQLCPTTDGRCTRGVVEPGANTVRSSTSRTVTPYSDASSQVGVEGWLEAFAAHPRIGDVASLKAKFGAFATHSKSEQATALTSDNDSVYQVHMLPSPCMSASAFSCTCKIML